MKIAGYVAFGLVAGAAAGFVLPIALAAAIWLVNPEVMEKGGATPFAILMIVMGPIGAIVGAGMGAQRGVSGHWFQGLAEFPYRAEGTLPSESDLAPDRPHEQAALAAIGAAFQRYRAAEASHLVSLCVWGIVSCLIPILTAMAIWRAWQLYAGARDMSAALNTSLERHGAEVVEALKPLPPVLRLVFGRQ